MSFSCPPLQLSGIFGGQKNTCPPYKKNVLNQKLKYLCLTMSASAIVIIAFNGYEKLAR